MRKNKLIICLFLLGILIVTFPHLAQYVNNLKQKQAVHHFKENAESLPTEVIEKRRKAANECNEELATDNPGMRDPFTESYANNQYKDCQSIVQTESREKGYGHGFATIEIPKLQLEIPIYLGATENELSKGIGQVEGSSLPVGGSSTHTVLAGHRGMGVKEMFRNLDELEKGDVFYIYTLGEKLTYHIYNTEVILPFETDILQIEEDRDLASLVTCHPYRHNSHRLIIQGEHVE